MKTVWIVVCTGIFSAVLTAQTKIDPNSPQSLQDYLRIAAQNNPQIKAAFHGWRQAVEQIPQARTLDDPRLSYQVEGIENSRSSQEQTIFLTQMFPWFGVLDAREEEASAMSKAARKNYESALLSLARDVKDAFFTFHYLARSVEVTRDNVSLVRHFEQVARGRYAAGAAAHPDVIRSQIEVAMLEDRLAGLEQLRPAVVAKLNAILNRPAESVLDWPRPEPYAAVTVEFAPLFAGMLKQNPDLISLEHRIAAMRSRETLAQSKSKPNFELGFGFKDLAEPSGSMGSAGSDDPLMAMISISLPIWSESYAAARRAARAERLQVVHEKIQLENTLGSQIKQALYELQDADRRIVLYRDTVLPKAQEMLVSSEMAYQAGTIDFLSLIDAQRSILQFRLEYEELLANSGKSLAELEMLAGGSLTGVAAKESKATETK
jgi:cobalt-zinc-cadmium efflux system outer membrane protein